MSRIRFAALLGGTLLLFAHHGVARADEASAERSFQQGVRYFDQKDFPSALDAFQRAFSDVAKERYLWNVAPVLVERRLAELRLGHSFAALRHFEQCKADPSANQSHTEHVDQLIAKARDRVAHLRIEAPAGAQIELDGKTVGMAPLADAIDVDPDAPHSIDVKVGRETMAQHLPPPGKGDVVVRFGVLSSNPPPPVSPAPSQVTLQPAFPADSAHASPTSPSADATRNIVVAIAGTVAIVSLGLAIGYDVAAGNQGDDAAQLRQQAAKLNPGVPQQMSCLNSTLPQCTELAQANESQTTDNRVSTVLFIAGAVVAAGAIATFFAWPRGPKARQSVWLLPSVGAHASALGVVGTF